jgi:uncharacterized protein YhaN
MSPDEVERTVQFLLQQQAHFDARIDRLAGKTEQVTEGLIGLTAVMGRLVESQARTDEQMRITGEQMRATDARLNELTQRFTQHLRDDHGDSQP